MESSPDPKSKAAKARHLRVAAMKLVANGKETEACEAEVAFLEASIAPSDLLIEYCLEAPLWNSPEFC